MGFLDPSSWANAFDTSAEDATNKSIDQQAEASNKAIQLQRDQFDYQKKLNQPFYSQGLPSFYSMVAGITGKPVEYDDPNYTPLTSEEVRSYLLDQRVTKDTPGGIRNWNTNDVNGIPERQLPQVWKDAQGNYTTSAPRKLTATFNPQESEAYKWQKERGLADLGRVLRSQGRGNSTYGMNATGRFLGDLNANEFDKQLGRLSDLTNVSRGGASSLANASSGYTNAASQNLINMGNNQANATMGGALMRQGSLYNGQQSGLATANAGLKLYDYGKSSGWWGGGGGDGYSADFSSYPSFD